MILGNLTTNLIELPLRGRPVINATILDSDGLPVSLDSRTVTFKVFDYATSAAPLMTLTSGAEVTHLLPLTDGKVQIELTNGQKALLSGQALYAFELTVTDDASGQIVQTTTGSVLPLLAGVTGTAAVTTGAVSTLSNRFTNVLSLSGTVGGAGFLDGVSTVAQAVGCFVEFYNPVTQVVERYMLEAGAAVGPGFVAPLDYNAATNSKRWKQVG